MKKLICCLILLLSSSSAFARSSQSVALFWGSVMSGVEYNAYTFRIAVGVESFGVSVDKLFFIGIGQDKRIFDFYAYFGAQYAEKHTSSGEVGVRGGAGANFHITSNSGMFFEIGPVVYLTDTTHSEFDGRLGFKVFF